MSWTFPNALTSVIFSDNQDKFNVYTFPNALTSVIFSTKT